MQEAAYITILSNGTKLVLNVDTILYVLMSEKAAEIHVAGGKIYETRRKLSELEEALGGIGRFLGELQRFRGDLVNHNALVLGIGQQAVSRLHGSPGIGQPDISGAVRAEGRGVIQDRAAGPPAGCCPSPAWPGTAGPSGPGASFVSS